MEYIHRRKAEDSRQKLLSDQADARRTRVKAARTRRADRVQKRQEEMIAAAVAQEKKK